MSLLPPEGPLTLSPRQQFIQERVEAGATPQSAAYQWRIFSGQQRGLTRQEARGHRPTLNPYTGEMESESQRRRRLARQRDYPGGGGIFPPVQTPADQMRALGYDEYTTGFSTAGLNAIAPTFITAWNLGSSGRIVQPSMMADANRLMGESYTISLYQSKLTAMTEWRQIPANQKVGPRKNLSGPGSFGDEFFADRISYIPVEFFWYH